MSRMGNFLSLIFFLLNGYSYLVSSPRLTTKKNDSVFSFPLRRDILSQKLLLLHLRSSDVALELSVGAGIN